MSDLNDMVNRGLKVAGDPSMADDYRETMRAAGIDPMLPPEAPDPGPILDTVGMETLLDPLLKREGVKQATLPMRLIGKPWTQPGQGKFPGYKSFILIPSWHPTQGAKLVTTSYEREDGSITAIGQWVMGLKKGDVFQVGEVGTDKGRTTYRPISVE